MRPRRPNRRLSVGNLQRIVILGILFGVVTFGILFAKLWQLQVVEHDTLTERAVKQQTCVTTSNAHRGTIFDANGDVLAISGSVKNVVLSPRDILAAVEVDTTDEFGNPRSQTVIDAERTQKAQEKIDIIAEGMADILGIDPNIVYQKVQEKPNSAWQVIAEKVPDETGDEVNAFVEENDLKGCVYCTDDSKRYYPYSYLATQVVGFVNSENQGAYGVEALYNNELSGENGRTITSKNASGREMLSKYADRSTTQNGYNVNLTIDTTIQLYAETVLEQGIAAYDVINGAFCIVMDPNTGAVLALASSPDYDLNDPNTVSDPVALARLAKLRRDPSVSQEEYDAMIQELAIIPDKIEKVLKLDDRIKTISRTYTYATNFLYLGRGWNYPVALEGALKLKEISYIHAEGYPAAEMKHGPIALVDDRMPVLFVATHHKQYQKIVSNMEEVKARGGHIIAVITEGDTEIPKIADECIEVPHTLAPLAPLLTVIPLQLLAYHVAVCKGLNVDQPRNLAKSVTVE